MSSTVRAFQLLDGTVRHKEQSSDEAEKDENSMIKRDDV